MFISSKDLDSLWNRLQKLEYEVDCLKNSDRYRGNLLAKHGELIQRLADHFGVKFVSVPAVEAKPASFKVVKDPNSKALPRRKDWKV